MLEEEMRAGDQEREALRIETQRLRDELSDLRVEAEITTEKLRSAEATIERLHIRKPMYLTSDTVLPRSPTSEISRTDTSSPTMSTPPPIKSDTSHGSGVPTPPSPPLSDAAAHPNPVKTPIPFRRRSLVPDLVTTPRVGPTGATKPFHSRAPSLAVSTTPAGSNKMGPPLRPNIPQEALPRSSSLYQIKGLIGRMQKIEERVHSVRSKLPPPTNATPRASPRPPARSSPRGSRVGSAMPASVTLRSSARKRPSNGATLSAKLEESISAGRSSTSGVTRLSFGMPPPPPQQLDPTVRPSSRASNISHHSINNNNDIYARPPSRSANSVVSATSGRASALGFHSTTSQPFAPARPRSSLGGSYGVSSQQQSRGHRPSMSASSARSSNEDASAATPSAKKRTTLDRSAIPAPGTVKRQSGMFGGSVVHGRRPSSVAGHHYDYEGMPPPPPTGVETTARKLSDVGETY